MNDKPILCVDFDGVIHSYESGWRGATIVMDPPVKGVFDWLRRAVQHFDVHVYSSRSKEMGGISAMRMWFVEQGAQDLLPLLRFPQAKPAAFITIDDRAVCFRGDWSARELDPQVLLQFKPWNK